MSAKLHWKGKPGRCVLVIGMSTLAYAMADSALGCGVYSSLKPSVQKVAPMRDGAQLIPAVLRASDGGFLSVGYQTSAANPGIVGLWQFALVSDGVPPNPVPEGAPVDFGTTQWHQDGTEFMISGARAPSTGDVCMGVWEQIGPGTYKLKHVALAWVSTDTPPSMGGPGPSPAQFLGPALIQEVVTLDKSRTSYEGTFTLDQYNADESVRLVHVSGTVTGTRVTVD